MVIGFRRSDTSQSSRDTFLPECFAIASLGMTLFRGGRQVWKPDLQELSIGHQFNNLNLAEIPRFARYDTVQGDVRFENLTYKELSSPQPSL
jgi:hypothetical protein